ncbi:MAG: TIGR04076 family protein [Solirubrobacteraceae bacterium]
MRQVRGRAGVHDRHPWDAPEGFCQWAWADLRSIIHRIHAGNPTTMVSCCTDGLRPVFFKFEAVDIDDQSSLQEEQPT